MRPLKVTISAFGPFADKTVIDMQTLGDSGVYLITGDTGAGKTTIFDAISFALYGKPSGNNREDNMLRSDYADPNTPTFVELLFEYNGKVYKVKRNPKYTRLKKNGTGFTVENKNAELTMPDGSIISGSETVTAEIVELIRLDRERFNKIAMIAQGDFQKLLFADTKERMPLFRKIFGTYNYKTMQDELKDLCDSIKAEYEQVSGFIRQNIASAVCDEDDENYADLEFYKQNEHSDTNAALKIISEITQTEELKVQTIDNDINRVESELVSLQNKIGAAQLIADKLKRAQELCKLIENAEIQLEKAQNDLKTAEENAQKVADLNETMVKIKNSLSEYDEFEKVKSEIANLKSLIETNSFNVSKLESKIAYNISVKDDLTKRISTEAEVKSANVTATGDFEKIKDRLSKLDQLNEWLNGYNMLKEGAQKAKLEYENAAKEYELIKNEYELKNTAYLNEQAGILASELLENNPCPVCGSLSHPNPAKLSKVAPSKDEIDKLKEAVDRANKQRFDLSEKSGKAKSEVSTLGERLIEESGHIFAEFDKRQLPTLIVNERYKISTQASSIKQVISTTEKTLSEIADFKVRLPQIESEIANGQAFILKLKTDLSTQTAQIEEKNLQLNKLAERLKYKCRDDAKSAILKLDTEISTLNNAVKYANEKMTAASSQIISYKGELEGLKGTQQTENLDELKLQNQKISADLKSFRSRRESILNNIVINQKAMKEIEKLSAKLINIREKLVTVEKLSNAASGSVTGKHKLSLEAHIQAVYFDRILNRANIRLMKMSSGRYEMKRAGLTDKKNAQTGLEIDIVDHYTGAVRKVKTLSGGESFMASLSLALGLSDEIQSSSGGIKLDCMFIDEGFGSLDETSLSLAMQAFGGLSNGRLVGIISHVAELKEKISKQIVVKKSRTGSCVDIICN